MEETQSLEETEKEIYENYKKLAYSFSLLSCYFHQLSSPKIKEAIKFEELFHSLNQSNTQNIIENNLNFTINPSSKIKKQKFKNKKKDDTQNINLKEHFNENKSENSSFDFSYLGKKRDNDNSELKINYEKENKVIQGKNKILYKIRIIFKDTNIYLGPYDDETFCLTLIEILETNFKNVEFSEFDFNDCVQNIKKKIYQQHPPINI